MSNKVIGREQCPECNDKSHDNLVNYSDGSTHCFACNYHTYPNGRTSRMSFELPENLPMPPSGIASKKLNHATLSRFGVVCLAKVDEKGDAVYKLNTKTGAHTLQYSDVIAFPYYDIETGVMVGAKMRRMTKDNTAKEMWWSGDASRASWYGINAMPASATKVVLVEGETDTLSVAQTMPDVAVLGLSGASSVDKAIRASLHVLKKYKQIVVLFDNDRAGAEATEKALKLLPPGKTYVAHYPSDAKDASVLVQSGREADLKRVVKDAKQVTPKGVVDEADLKKRLFDYIFNRESARGSSTGYKELDRATGGLAPGKLITICGGTGSGKSTFAESIAVNAALQEGTNTFFIPLEMTDTQVSARMVQQIIRQPIASDPYFNVNTLDTRKLDKALEVVANHIKFYDHFGSIDMATLIETCEFAIDALDCKVVVLDHLTAAASGSEGLDWKALDMAASQLKSLALRKNVCIIVVSHISRDGDNEDNVPQLRHIRGGNGIAQYSDCVLGVGRKRDSDTMKVRTIKVDRMVGKFVEFELKYDRCALVDNGHSFTQEEEEYTYEEETSDGEQRQENREVQEPVRSTRSTTKPANEVRTTEDTLHSETYIYSGLSTPRQYLFGSEGDTYTIGQDEALGGEDPEPRPGTQAVVLEWWNKTKP